MIDKDRESMLAMIRENIDRSGHHVYFISGGMSPRFAYTIGLIESIGYELVLAGSSFFSIDEVRQIINGVAKLLRSGAGRESTEVEVDSLGSFSLRASDPSWVKRMMFGALDYYEVSDIKAFQIVPDEEHSTIDIPNMSHPWAVDSEPVWQWLESDDWEYQVPRDSVVVTNLDALKGSPVTEVMRWEEGEWEMFAGAGPDVPKDEIREVSLGTLLGADGTLAPVASLGVGKGIWRDPEELEWHSWN